MKIPYPVVIRQINYRSETTSAWYCFAVIGYEYAHVKYVPIASVKDVREYGLYIFWYQSALICRHFQELIGSKRAVKPAW